MLPNGVLPYPCTLALTPSFFTYKSRPLRGSRCTYSLVPLIPCMSSSHAYIPAPADSLPSCVSPALHSQKHRRYTSDLVVKTLWTCWQNPIESITNPSNGLSVKKMYTVDSAGHRQLVTRNWLASRFLDVVDAGAYSQLCRIRECHPGMLPDRMSA